MAYTSKTFAPPRPHHPQNSEYQQFEPPVHLDCECNGHHIKCFQIVTIISILMLVVGVIAAGSRLIALEDHYYSYSEKGWKPLQQTFQETHLIGNTSLSWHTWAFTVKNSNSKFVNYPDKGSVPHLDINRLVYHALCCRDGPTFLCGGSSSYDQTEDFRFTARKNYETGEHSLVVSLRGHNLVSKLCIYSFALETLVE